MTTLHELGEDMRNRIQELAYLMWESAGRQQGMALEYWVAAEREILKTVQAATDRMITASAPAAPPAATPSKAANQPAKLAKPAAAEPAARPSVARPAAEPPAAVKAPAAAEQPVASPDLVAAGAVTSALNAAEKPKRRTAGRSASKG